MKVITTSKLNNSIVFCLEIFWGPRTIKMGAESWGPSIRAKGSNVKEYKHPFEYVYSSKYASSNRCLWKTMLHKSSCKQNMLITQPKCFCLQRFGIQKYNRNTQCNVELKVQLKQTWPKWDHQMTITSNETYREKSSLLNLCLLEKYKEFFVSKTFFSSNYKKYFCLESLFFLVQA